MLCIFVAVKKPQQVPEKKVTAEAPRFVELLQGQSVNDGDSVTLLCRISGQSHVFICLVFQSLFTLLSYSILVPSGSATDVQGGEIMCEQLWVCYFQKMRVTTGKPDFFFNDVLV